MHSLSSLPYLNCEYPWFIGGEPRGVILLLSYVIIGDFAKNFSEEFGDWRKISGLILGRFGTNSTL